MDFQAQNAEMVAKVRELMAEQGMGGWTITPGENRAQVHIEFNASYTEESAVVAALRELGFEVNRRGDFCRSGLWKAPRVAAPATVRPLMTDEEIARSSWATR